MNIKEFEAAIIDMDGVLTTTADQHARAWKKMFDEYNEQRRQQGKTTYRELSIEDDYPKYIDGIPRYDGVQKFLKSRGIELPYGSPEDEPGKETICGLGNRKNHFFLKLIEKEGVERYENNVQQIRKWKRQGLKIAVISSSRNCRQIMKAAKLDDLYDVLIDGIVSAERNISGKPSPDVFLEAAHDLGVTPDKTFVVEDAQAGIRAGKAGNFKWVVGIINSSGRQELLDMGADETGVDLGDLQFSHQRDYVRGRPSREPQELPNALDHLPELLNRMQGRRPLIFLDFDGTLAPIVEMHEDAAMSDEMRELMKALASEYSIAVISGRGLDDVRKRVGLKDIYYSGSHGFEMAGPGGFFKESDKAKEILPVLDKLEPVLFEKLNDIPGVSLERKKFTIAVHYRQVPPEREKDVAEIVKETLLEFQELKVGSGKKVFDIRPGMDWGKGNAVGMLIAELADKDERFLPIYIGDDVTDEDVFDCLGGGIGILVGDHGKKTYADYCLDSVDEVEELLRKLVIRQSRAMA